LTFSISSNKISIMLVIRLRRTGKKKKPSFRVVVAEKTMPIYGRFVDIIGNVNIKSDPKVINIDKEKVLGWIKKGAKPSHTVARLMIKQGILKEEDVKMTPEKKRIKKKELKAEKGGEKTEGAKEAAAKPAKSETAKDTKTATAKPAKEEPAKPAKSETAEPAEETKEEVKEERKETPTSAESKEETAKPAETAKEEVVKTAKEETTTAETAEPKGDEKESEEKTDKKAEDSESS